MSLLQHLYYLGSSPQGFLSSQKGLSLDPIGRLCATFGTFGYSDTTFHINRLFAPSRQPARCSIYRAIVICEMSDPWPDMMTKFIISPVKSSTDNRFFFFFFFFFERCDKGKLPGSSLGHCHITKPTEWSKNSL